MDKLKAIERKLSKTQEEDIDEFQRGVQVEQARKLAEELREERDEK